MHPSLLVVPKRNIKKMWGSISTSGYYISNQCHSHPVYPEKVNQGDGNLEEDKCCLCRQIHSIWTLSQIIGINPLSFRCGHCQNWKTRPKRRTNWRCHLEKKKRGLPFINNIVLLILHILSAYKMSTILTNLLTLIFKGTDVYACRIHLAARVWQTLTLIMAGGIFPQNLINAWELIQTVSRAMNYTFPKYIKTWSIGLTCLCLVVVITNVIYTVYVNIKFCFFSDEVEVNCNLNGITGQLVFVFSIGSAEVYHLALASLLFTFALVVMSLGRGVADLVKERLECHEEGVYFLDLDEEIERLRLLYERIHGIVVFLRKFFGVSGLVICCDAVLTCIFGFYWRILYFENLSEHSERGVNNYLLFTLQMFFSVISLLLVLIAGQVIANSSYFIMEVIRTTKLSRLNSAERFQINLLMQSCSGFPTKFSVYFITNLEMQFLAAAATNVITYLLVLMQFRLEQEKY